MRFEESNMYFYMIENFAYGEINERSFSNPHPWSPTQTIWRGSSEIPILWGAPDNDLPPPKLSQFTYLQDTNDTVISKCCGPVFCTLKWGPDMSYNNKWPSL